MRNEINYKGEVYMENYEVMNNVNEGVEVVEELSNFAEVDLLPT